MDTEMLGSHDEDEEVEVPSTNAEATSTQCASTNIAPSSPSTKKRAMATKRLARESKKAKKEKDEKDGSIKEYLDPLVKCVQILSASLVGGETNKEELKKEVFIVCLSFGLTW